MPLPQWILDQLGLANLGAQGGAVPDPSLGMGDQVGSPMPPDPGMLMQSQMGMPDPMAGMVNPMMAMPGMQQEQHEDGPPLSDPLDQSVPPGGAPQAQVAGIPQGPMIGNPIQDPNSMGAAMNMIGEGMGEQINAEAGKAEAMADIGGQIGAETGKAFSDNDANMIAVEKAGEEQRKKLAKEADDLSRQKVDPGRVFKDAGTLKTIAAIFGAALMGFSDPKNGPARAAAAIDRAIENDINAQVANIQIRQQGVENKRTLLNDSLQSGLRMYEARYKSIGTMYGLAIDQMNNQLKYYDAAGTRAAGKQIVGAMRARYAEQGEMMKLAYAEDAMMQGQKDAWTADGQASPEGQSNQNSQQTNYRGSSVPIGAVGQLAGIEGDEKKGIRGKPAHYPAIEGMKPEEVRSRAMADPADPRYMLGIATTGNEKQVMEAQQVIKNNYLMASGTAKLRNMHKEAEYAIRTNSEFFNTQEGKRFLQQYNEMYRKWSQSLTGASVGGKAEAESIEASFPKMESLPNYIFQKVAHTDRGNPDAAWENFQRNRMIEAQANAASIGLVDPTKGQYGEPPSDEYWMNAYMKAPMQEPVTAMDEARKSLGAEEAVVQKPTAPQQQSVDYNMLPPWLSGLGNMGADLDNQLTQKMGVQTPGSYFLGGNLKMPWE